VALVVGVAVAAVAGLAAHIMAKKERRNEE
jgi:hypothetical protein